MPRSFQSNPRLRAVTVSNNPFILNPKFSLFALSEGSIQQVSLQNISITSSDNLLSGDLGVINNLELDNTPLCHLPEQLPKQFDTSKDESMNLNGPLALNMLSMKNCSLRSISPNALRHTIGLTTLDLRQN